MYGPRTHLSKIVGGSAVELREVVAKHWHWDRVGGVQDEGPAVKEATKRLEFSGSEQGVRNEVGWHATCSFLIKEM
jgi:hypothetical protein